jgi:hypothetical protein
VIEVPAEEIDVLAGWPEAPFPFPFEGPPVGPVPPSSSSPPLVPEGERFPLSRPRRARRSARSVLPKDPALFGWLARRFAAGEATLWVGASWAIEELLETLYAGSALVRGRVSLLEGANRFHPYRIGERGRALGIDPGTVLERVRLARAFTAYQLVSLVDAWSSEVRRRPPSLMVAHAPSDLFLTSEVPEIERGPLLQHVAVTLRALTRSSDCPLLITCPGGLSQFPGLREHGPPLYDMVRFTPGPHQLVLDAYREEARLTLVARAAGQHGLDEFGTFEATEEVIAWDARHQRTAKRSRSG